MSTEEYIDISKYFAIRRDASYDSSSKIATLTPDKVAKIGAITGLTQVNLKLTLP